MSKRNRYEEKHESKHRTSESDSDETIGSGSESDGDEDRLIKLSYLGKTIAVKEIGQEEGWTRKTPEDHHIDGACSWGFACCMGIVCRTRDGSYISLMHNSSAADAPEAIEEEVARIKKKGGKEVIVFVGYNKKSFEQETIDSEKGSVKKHSAVGENPSEEELLSPTPGITEGWRKISTDSYNEYFMVLKKLKAMGVQIINLPEQTILAVSGEERPVTNIKSRAMEKALSAASKSSKQHGKEESDFPPGKSAFNPKGKALATEKKDKPAREY
jgi:hypothetical protein